MKTQEQIQKEKNNYPLKLYSIDGNFCCICLLGENKIVFKKEFEKLKTQYQWITDF